MTNESSEHPSFVGRRHITIVRSWCSRGDHQQIIAANADRSRTRGRPERAVPTSHWQPRRPARPCPMCHQILTKHSERRERSNRKIDRPTKTSQQKHPTAHQSPRATVPTNDIIHPANHQDKTFTPGFIPVECRVLPVLSRAGINHYSRFYPGRSGFYQRLKTTAISGKLTYVHS